TTIAPGIEIRGDKIKSSRNGKSYIQASWYANGQRRTSALCTVTSESILREVWFENYEVQMDAGTTFQLEPHYDPGDATIKSKSYTSNNANITVTNDGLITASPSCTNNDTANITVKINQADTKTIRVKICTPVTNIALNNCGAEGELVIMNTGDTWQLSAEAVPNVDTVTWSSKYPNDVTIDETGKITALRAGGTAIYAYAGQIAKVMKYIIVVDKNEYEIIKTNENLTGNFDGYTTKTNGTLAFSKSKLDIAVKDKSGNWVSPTNKLGLKWKINDTALTFTDGRGDASSLALLVTPVLVKDKANNEEKVLFGQAIIKATNNSISTGVKFGSWVTLSNADSTPITLTTTNVGVQTEVNKTNFTLECKKQSSTVFIGTSSNAQSMIYSNSTATTFTGTDVGAAFSYYAGMMGPNAVKTACFTLGCSAIQTDGSVDVIVY
ncbi:MAG: Ig-like domain-containing protein, partial [Spirochaetales bacterium]|nr:Ig-like domain-containing protein [Spirochaetales bacterium]